MSRKFVPILAAAAIALIAAGPTMNAVAASQKAVGAGDDWPAVGGGFDETGYSRLAQIDAANAGKLGLAWSLDLPGEVTLEATPLEVGGVVYFTGSYAKVYAVDAATGKQLWTYDPEVWKHHPDKMHFSFGANRGMAYENGKVFAAALDGRIFALDAKTGKELWIAESIPPGAFNISTGAPRVMNGKVIIGNGGADFGARGFVTAFDANTGRQLWRFYTVPGTPDQNRGDPAMEAAAKSWGANFTAATGGGGTVWNGITFDPELNRVYIGAGNAGPYDPQKRDPAGGDDLYTSSIVALDADTGKYIWHYQENPRDSWDYKATPNIVTATLTIDGKPRDVILHAPTNGFLYVIDRRTGKVISAGGTTVITWAKGIDLKTGRPIEEPDIRYETGLTKIWPGTVGGHNWQAMSFSPKTGLVYIPVQQIGARFSREGGSENAFNVMGLMLEPIVEQEGDGHGYLVAWNPVTQQQAWRVRHKGLWNGGTLATAGGLVFQGTADGFLRAFDGVTGKEVWKFDAGLGIIGAPISYSLGGRQYVSVLVGYGGTTSAYGHFMDMGYKYGLQPRRLLTFALDGKQSLPASPPPNFVVSALDDPDYKLVEADVQAGRALSIRCAACHGVGLQATGTPGPDLRESAIALNLDSFSTLLKTGALIERGMPRFDMLSDDEIRQLHAYVRAKAREALGKRAKEANAPMPRM
ncbi:PQQ-dependent dehydrogenase, methanol/ethanol family [Novosphingobium album (ex Liu et al. 2023)]|uniref:PQQ-dependent dehydrogenase, methanol/ethanol family n=1 Tax=Novosphingobium album (ex Liu et al. 2023) TaxID=3031130 RepID=A0ABT5WUR7_9SPHN|nr:PQQ-dependent dehydrogenase, methanol/ethanol family [Novosphingobium album (ex Liu et al. 2023)]MDE8653616.1 PQQ-dependent dehydrogenase, methanol/ethanol family [Novosphingobium album (ex Liu et al. 2023)]